MTRVRKSPGPALTEATVSQGRALAEAYLRNVDNRGMFERNRDYSARAVRECGPGASPVDFMLSERRRKDAQAELDSIARQWDRYLHSPVRRVLDAGCGPGLTTLALSARYPGARIDGVDVERPALELARHLAMGESRCNFHETPLESFKPEAGYDLIQCRAVLEHVFDPRAVLARLLGWLRLGGTLYVETPNYIYPWEPHVRLPILPKGPKRLIELECRLTGRDPAFVRHLNLECDPWTLRRWARAAGIACSVIDLMKVKAEAIFLEGDQEPSTGGRVGVVRVVRRSTIASRLAVQMLKAFPISPSVMLLFVRKRDGPAV